MSDAVVTETRDLDAGARASIRIAGKYAALIVSDAQGDAIAGARTMEPGENERLLIAKQKWRCPKRKVYFHETLCASDPDELPRTARNKRYRGLTRGGFLSLLKELVERTRA